MAYGSDGAWRFQGGLHPSSAVVASMLTNAGTPVSEPMAFLAGGGIGAGYILWEWQRDGSNTLVLAFQNEWQYYGRWMPKAFTRFGADFEEYQTGSVRAASKTLADLLRAGRPCVVLPDRYQVGYWGWPPALDGKGGHPVIAYRIDGSGGREGSTGADDVVRVDDRGRVPILVPRKWMDAARARVGSYKNVLYVLREQDLKPDLEWVAREGLRECAEHLSGMSDSFSLPAWRKWARLMTDTRNPKGWPQVFPDGAGLAGAMMAIWESVRPVGMEGGNLRDLFADGLDEAAILLGEPELAELAEEYRRIYALWIDLSQAAESSGGEVDARIRELTAVVRQSVLERGWADEEAAGELWDLRARVDREPRSVDFADLAARIAAIYSAESAAIARLRGIV